MLLSSVKCQLGAAAVESWPNTHLHCAQADADWQQLLGPPENASLDVRLRAQLKAAFGKLAGAGALPEWQLPTACQLADLVQFRIHRMLKAGVLTASVLVLLGTARGEPVAPNAAAAAVREAGLEATSQAVNNQLPLLLRQWQVRAVRHCDILYQCINWPGLQHCCTHHAPPHTAPIPTIRHMRAYYNDAVCMRGRPCRWLKSGVYM
jgi:hypothetical protein